MSTIVVIAAFAGGLDAIQKLLATVPAASGGSIFIVLHIGDHQTGQLSAVLGQKTGLPISHPIDGTRIRPGHVMSHRVIITCCCTTATPAWISKGRLNHGAKVNWTCPAAAPLFISAAEAYGALIVGIVLTGYLHDGAVGLAVLSGLAPMTDLVVAGRLT